MKSRLLIAATIVSALFVSGCATSRSTIDIPVAAPAAMSNQNGKEIYINSVTDNRVFEVKPSNPNTPSLDPSEAQGMKIQLRAIGRKRNGYGKGLGDILLPEGKTVETLIESVVSKELVNKGYTVIASKELITRNTYVADVKINKLWSWMNPGAFAITLSTEISTDIAIKGGASTESKEISVKASHSYQVATESNWLEIMQVAFSKYAAELDRKL